jgi:hypothetical protein
MLASVRKLNPSSRNTSWVVTWVVTPTWAGPGRDGCIWMTPARQLVSLL